MKITSSNVDLSSTTQVTVGGVTAVLVSTSVNEVTALVMPGSSTDSVAVTHADGIAASQDSFSVTPTGIITTHQGAKLVGMGGVGAPFFGGRLAISADGNTAAISGPSDNSNKGAIWVFTRSASTWTQMGGKLVGSDMIGAGFFGQDVDIDAGGMTIIAGGYADNSNQGAAWIFTRSGDTWTQQGKLTGTGNVGAAEQGTAVALSADGNTAIIGGPGDNSNQGASWIFTRSANTWTQQGTKIVGTNNNAATFGVRLSLSADSSTLLVSGYEDSGGVGAVWIFTRSGSTWSQQGSKLVGTGYVGTPKQGVRIKLSADGNTAISGGYFDNSNQGATWVFTRSGTTWAQQGSKLVGSGNIGAAEQGLGLALSADGNVALIGGRADNSSQGAVWVFTRSGTTWSQRGAKLVGPGGAPPSGQGRVIAITPDGNTAIWGGDQDNSNQGAAWVFVP